MKKILFIFYYLLQGSFVYSQHHGGIPDCLIQVYSKETNLDTINERFYIHYKIYFTDTFDTDSLKIMTKLPQIADLSSESPYFNSAVIQLPNSTYYPGDSLSDSIEINFSKSHIPFYFQALRLCLTNFADSIVLFSEPLRIYFTPYNTIEMWNIDDFDGLKRIWDTHIGGLDTLRQYVHKDSLPVSDMADSTFFNE